MTNRVYTFHSLTWTPGRVGSVVEGAECLNPGSPLTSRSYLLRARWHLQWEPSLGGTCCYKDNDLLLELQGEEQNWTSQGSLWEVGSFQSQLRSHKPPSHKRPYITGPFNTVGWSLWTPLNNVFTCIIQNIQNYRGNQPCWNKWIKIFLKVSQNNIHTSSLPHLIMISSSRSDKKKKKKLP